MKEQKGSETGRSSGQVLVFFAAAILGLTAMLALVIDGGNFYLQRRGAQNAADAAALSVTYRMSVLGGEHCHDTEYLAILTDYANTRNTADAVEAVYLPGGVWPVGGG
jgi:Flp pilus assembly protein TadG